MKRALITISLGLLLLGSSIVTPAGQEAAVVEEGVDFCTNVFLRGTDGYHTYRIPTMVVTSKGTVLLFCEGRKNSRKDSGDIDMLLKRSEDGGRTWSKQLVLLDEGPGRVGNSCAIIERDTDVVHLLFTRGGGECVFYTKSADEGKTWSELVTTSDVASQKEYTKKNWLQGFGGSLVKIGAGPVHGIQTRKGRLIAPSYYSKMVGSERVGGSCIVYSDDRGETWRAGGAIPLVEEFRPGECTVVERSDGSLLMNMRSGAPGAYALGYRIVSTSADDGATWSQPVIDKNLPGPACQGSMIRLSEKEILFLNPAVHRAGGFHLWSRRNLTLRLSQDDGRTWSHSRVLRKQLAGYSDMAVTKEGKILCVFENGEGDYCERISFTQVDRAWLVADQAAEQEEKPEKE
ncbi:exo-alpha-sialidase [Candidatus Sumerlaeota bacterium]